MPLLSMILMSALSTSVGPAPAPEPHPAGEQVRQTVERGLKFLEKSGSAWWAGNKCASCHHVPITIWSLTEAKARGLAVDSTALDRLREAAVASYATHPTQRPVGQDGGDTSMVSLNTIYLTLAVVPADKLDDKTAEAVKTFSGRMLALQTADGSWKSTSVLPPVGDNTEVRTMQVLLALAAASDKGLLDSAKWGLARDRALGWVAKHKFQDQNQTLNLRLLVAQRFGRPEEVQSLVAQLLRQQEPDGGWSQTREGTSEVVRDYDEKPTTPAVAKPVKRPSDAMATGQTLYALARAGVDPSHPAIHRAESYLVRNQTNDGSWRVPIRSQKNSGTALSHYGTGWAVLGLMQTMALPSGGQAGALQSSVRP